MLKRWSVALVAVMSLMIGISFGTLRGETTKKQPTLVTVNGPASTVRTGSDQVLVFGENLGLRIDGKRGQRVTGTLVARVDGRWVEVQLDSYNAMANH